MSPHDTARRTGRASEKAPSPADAAPTSVSATAALFVAGVAVTADAATDLPLWGHFYGLASATHVTSAICAAALTALACLSLKSGSTSRAATGVAPRLAPLPPLIVSLLWSRALIESFSGPLWTAFAAASVLAVGAAALKRVRALHIAALAAAIGVCFRIAHFSRFPLYVGADMLPLVRAALRALTSGHSPYAHHNLPSPLPLTYHPLTWLAYLPAHLVGVDLRATNVLANLSIPLAIARATGLRLRRDTDSAAATWALLAWSACFLLPSAIYFDRITTAPITWAVLAWTLAAFVRESRHQALWVAACAATTPLTLPIAPLFIAVWWRRHGFGGAAARALVALCAACALTLPFFAWAPRAFIDGVVLWFNDLSRFPTTRWNALGTWSRYAGFSGLFWRAGAASWLRLLQLGAIAAVSALYVHRLRTHAATVRDLPAHAAAALTVFMVVNPVLWPYFYQPALVCGLLAVSAGGASAPSTTPIPAR